MNKSKQHSFAKPFNISHDLQVCLLIWPSPDSNLKGVDVLAHVDMTEDHEGEIPDMVRLWSMMMVGSRCRSLLNISRYFIQISVRYLFELYEKSWVIKRETKNILSDILKK